MRGTFRRKLKQRRGGLAEGEQDHTYGKSKRYYKCRPSGWPEIQKVVEVDGFQLRHAVLTTCPLRWDTA